MKKKTDSQGNKERAARPVIIKEYGGHTFKRWNDLLKKVAGMKDNNNNNNNSTEYTNEE